MDSSIYNEDFPKNYEELKKIWIDKIDNERFHRPYTYVEAPMIGDKHQKLANKFLLNWLIQNNDLIGQSSIKVPLDKMSKFTTKVVVKKDGNISFNSYKNIMSRAFLNMTSKSVTDQDGDEFYTPENSDGENDDFDQYMNDNDDSSNEKVVKFI